MGTSKKKAIEPNSKIEGAAIRYANCGYFKGAGLHGSNVPSMMAFYKGALSPEAKEYWQKAMYTEERVLKMLDDVMNLGMDLRQNQLAGRSYLSGKDALCTYWKQNRESEETLFSSDIDTIGKCANCGVEFHIHKSEQQRMYTKEDMEEAFRAGELYANNGTYAQNEGGGDALPFIYWINQIKKNNHAIH